MNTQYDSSACSGTQVGKTYYQLNVCYYSFDVDETGAIVGYISFSFSGLTLNVYDGANCTGSPVSTQPLPTGCYYDIDDESYAYSTFLSAYSEWSLATVSPSSNPTTSPVASPAASTGR